MLALLIEKKIRNYVLTFRFVAALLATFVLVIVSVWVLADDFIQRQNTYTRLVSEYAEKASEVRVPSQIKPLVHRPPSPLGIFARGYDAQLGNSVTVSRWEVPRKADETLAVNPLLSAMPQFDLQTIFAVVISIFALLISYDALCGEKESGTLKMIYSNRVSLALIFVANLIAGTLVLIFPFLLSFFSALLILLFVHGLSFTGAQWLAIGAMVLAGLLFSALFIAIGLLCSATMKRSSSALMLAMFAWTVLVVLLPPLGDGLAAMLVPLDPPDILSSLEQETQNTVYEQMMKFKQEKAPHSESGWGVRDGSTEDASLFDAPPEYFNDSMRYIAFYELLYQQRADRIWQEAAQEEAKKLEQAKTAGKIKFLSPSYLLGSAFSALAGTDYEAYSEFLERARRYRGAILEEFRNRGLFTYNVHQLFSRRPLEEINDEKAWKRREQEMKARMERGESPNKFTSLDQYDPLPSNYIPPFDARAPEPRFVEAATPITALAIAVLLVSAVGLAIFTRYDVR
jgi:ABC-type transport system involved in multi-copper enzyme maturation permease subunit